MSLVTFNNVRYYTADDPFHYTVDNRPLQDLAANDVLLQTAIDSIATSLSGGNVSVKIFNAGTDFTAGTTTQLTLPSSPFSSTGIWIFFDGIMQNDNTYNVSSAVVTFTSAIPTGVSTVEVKWVNALLLNTPSDGTVTDAKVFQGSKLYNRISNVFNVKDPQFGAVGNGIADDTAAINAALSAANAVGGGIVEIPPGTYNVLGQIIGYSKVSLRGTIGKSIIDASGRASYLNNDTQALIMYKGSKGTAIALSADALFGATTITVGNTSGLSVGQMIELTANSTGGYSDTSVGVQQGELFFINALTSTVITLNRAISDASGYTVANSAVVAPITPVQDFEISGIKLIGLGRDPAGLQGGDNGIGVYYGLNVNIHDNITDKVDGRGIFVVCCYNWDIERNKTYFQPQGSSGLVNYGIYYSSSIYGRVTGNYGVNMRHAVVSGHLSMGLSEKYPGINRFIDISRNTALNAWLTGIATHNDVEYVTIHHNYVAGCVNGINARERNAYVTDNVIVGCSTNGIYLSGNPQNQIIARNRITGCTNGIATSFNAGWIASDIHIEDNTVNGFGALPANATGIYFSTASGVTTTNKNISIRRNKVFNLTGPGGNASAIRFNGYISGAIEGNVVSNCTMIGIRIDTAIVATEVRRNRVTNITGTAFSISGAGTDTFVTDNYIKGYTSGYSGISGVTNRNNDDGGSTAI